MDIYATGNAYARAAGDVWGYIPDDLSGDPDKETHTSLVGALSLLVGERVRQINDPVGAGVTAEILEMYMAEFEALGWVTTANLIYTLSDLGRSISWVIRQMKENGNTKIPEDLRKLMQEHLPDLLQLLDTPEND